MSRADAPKALRLERAGETWTLRELAVELTKQTKLPFSVEEAVEKVPIFVSNGSWTVEALVQAVDIAAGTELRKGGSTYRFAPSRAHETVFRASDNVAALTAAQESVLKRFAPRFSSEKARKNMAPFVPEQFLKSELVALDDLPPAQQEFLKARLPEELRAVPFQIRFVPMVWLSMVAGGADATDSFGTPLVADPPGEHLPQAGKAPPAYDAATYLKLFNAYIVPVVN